MGGEKPSPASTSDDGQNPSPTPSSSEDASPRKIHGFVWFVAVAATLSSIFLYSLDNTIVADITPTIVNTFGNVENLPWLSVGFLLGGEAAVLSFGKLYGLFDAKWIYIISAVIFNVGSAVCGAAPNLDALIVGRVIAGLGGNGMYLGVINLLSVNTTDRERPGYLGLNGLVWGVGTVLGPVVGGGFAESSATWRWAFYLNLCVAAVCAPVYLFWLPSFKPRPNDKPSTLLREYDFVGTLLIVGALITLIMGINFGGAVYAWNSGQNIALFVVSGVLFGLFGAQQTLCIFTSTKNRLFPVHFLKRYNAVLLFICAAASNCACFIPIYYIPLYFQFTRGDGAIDAAVRLMPYIIVLSAAILANGHLMGKFSYFQPWYIAGGILALVGGVLLSRIHTDTPEGEIYAYEVITGLGTGACAQAGYAVIQGMIAAEETAYSISFMMLAQTGGIALGLSLSGAVFINTAVQGLTTVLPGVPRAELQLAVSGTSGDYFRSLEPQQQEDSINAIVSALTNVFILVYVGAAVTLVCSLLFTKRKLYSTGPAIVG
ncbi:major facilitator superfamily domain-containing protein [Stachybotrys elegans]|uniref:Major facilitator superfamily domain-containing protein n=1 Tax=Stachybotrys elegans TaxID=80388 RepID=A0A8K0WVM8_9HYPO|nr:major facilitator superfamily domain-containing protein [Stachybotrys elegans]